MSIPSAFSLKTAATWQSCGASHVAVYGTLRAGATNDLACLHPGLACIGQTTLTGTLYDMGWYPGLRLEGTQSVLAEVYPLNPMLEQALDVYEGLWPRNTGEYAKRIVAVSVRLETGGVQQLPVLVYEAQPGAVAHLPVIEASDWLDWYRARPVL